MHKLLNFIKLMSDSVTKYFETLNIEAQTLIANMASALEPRKLSTLKDGEFFVVGDLYPKQRVYQRAFKDGKMVYAVEKDKPEYYFFNHDVEVTKITSYEKKKKKELLEKKEKTV